MSRFPLDARCELNLGGTWTDVTGYVYNRDEVTITRGRSAEAQIADPSQMTLTLDNRDGRFSPRNPTSPWYGLLGRNTPIRLSLPYGSSYLRVEPSTDGSRATTPNTDAITDLDVRVELDADRWFAGDLAGRYETVGSNRSWWFGMELGELELAWSPDGTSGSQVFIHATDRLDVARGRLAVRATLDVDNGAGGWTARFYAAPSLAGPWTQVGDPVTGTGTTSIYTGTAPIEVGDVGGLAISSAQGGAVAGRYLGFELRDGIDGTIVASADFSVQAVGTTSFADAQGNTWTVGDFAHIDDRDYRFWGEVGSWPQAWDASGRDAFSKITASGIRRRLGQGASPLRSTLYQVLTTGTPGTVAYWPCEDGKNATQFGSAFPGAAPMRFTGSPDTASFSDFVASDAVPIVKNSTWNGPVPTYTTTGQTQLRFMLALPDGGLTNGAVVARLLTTGTAPRYDVVYTTNLDGSLELRAYDGTGALLDGTSTTAGLNDSELCVSVELTQTGSNIAMQMTTMRVDELLGTGVTVFGSVSSSTVGRVTRVLIDPTGNVDDAAVGHISVHSVISDPFSFYNELGAFPSETALDRMVRLCSDEGVPLRAIGAAASSPAMGPQGIKTLLDLLDECADADLGIAYEPRDRFGLAYRARSDLYNQPPAATLSYADGEVGGELRPVDDDHDTRNDIRVTREGGSSVRTALEAGPLSVQEPPDGVGRYDDEVTVNVATDDQLPHQAGWRLHLGTVNEARYPVLSVVLHSPRISDDLAAALLSLDCGDRLVVTDLPVQLPPDDVSLIIQGYTERLTLRTHTIEFNLAPESPYHVGAVEVDGYDRIDTAGSVLAADASASATTLSVSAGGDTPWTTDPDDFPFDIVVAGERMTVTQISGTSSPQTFTVVRGVNGVTKEQKAGAEVRIAEPVYVAL